MSDSYVQPQADIVTTNQRNRNDALWYDQVKKMITPTTASYTVTNQDDYILCSSVTTTVILPMAARGREIYVIKNYASGTLTVLPTSPNTIFGASSLAITARESKHFKAITGGYVVL